MNNMKFQNEPEANAWYESRPGSYGFILNNRKVVIPIEELKS